MINTSKQPLRVDRKQVYVTVGGESPKRLCNCVTIRNYIVFFCSIAIILSFLYRHYMPSQPKTSQTTSQPKYEYNKVSKINPNFFDWREKGIVGPVKDQGKCNASYAFAAISAIESMYAMENNRTVLSFSEQQIIDCGNFTSPCQENILSHEFIKKNGIATEADYPSVGKENEKCKYDENKVKLWPTNVLLVENQDEALLKLIITHNGPGYFRMKTPPSFFNYETGIYNPTEEECGKATEARSLTIVGYGIEGGQNYWIVKGSFGTSWGEQGYMKLARDVNACGMADSISIPIEFELLGGS